MGTKRTCGELAESLGHQTKYLVTFVADLYVLNLNSMEVNLAFHPFSIDEIINQVRDSMVSNTSLHPHSVPEKGLAFW